MASPSRMESSRPTYEAVVKTSQNSLKGGYIRDHIENTIGVVKGDTRSLDYSSHIHFWMCGHPFVSVVSKGIVRNGREYRWPDSWEDLESRPPQYGTLYYYWLISRNPSGGSTFSNPPRRPVSLEKSSLSFDSH